MMSYERLVRIFTMQRLRHELVHTIYEVSAIGRPHHDTTGFYMNGTRVRRSWRTPL